MPDALPLLIAIALPFAGAVAAGLLPTHARNAAAWLAGGVALLGLAMVWAAYPTVSAGGVLRLTAAWMPSLGLDFSLRMDGFAWLFAGLVFGVGALVVVYARYYMAAEDPVPRFFAFLLAFMGSMTGVVLSGNLIQLAFFWELTSLFSFLLIGYWHHTAAARDGARMALTVTATGGLCLFAGVLILGHIVGSYELDAVLVAGDLIRAHPLYLPALVLILLGALTKSAQFPFHFWLPHAMAAPTPVSAYLHSATLVKAGVFLMARLWPVLAGTEAWFWIVGSAGAAGLFDDQPSRADHPAARPEQRAGDGGGDLPRHQPRHLQGLAVHGRRHHRPRDRDARHPAAVGAEPLHALHRPPRPDRRRRHGGRAAAERLPVEGDVLRRGALRQGSAAGLLRRAAGRGDGGQRLQRRLFAALHPRHLLRAGPGGPAAQAARAAGLDAFPGRGAGAGLHRHRHPAGRHRRPLSGHGRPRRARCSDAGIQPRGLARLQPAAGDEHGRLRRRADPLPAAAKPPRQGHRGAAADPQPGRAAHVRADDGLPVLAAGPHRRGGARHPPPAAAAAAGGGGRGAGRRLDRVDPGGGAGQSGAVGHRSGAGADLAAGGRLRPGCGLAGEVPPAGGADPARRHRAGRLRHLRLVLRPRPRAHPAAGGGGHHHPAAAGPALAAQAHGHSRQPWVGGGHADPPPARPRYRHRRRGRHGRAGLRGDDALPAGTAGPPFPGAGLQRGRRHQCRQHCRAGGGGDDRLCPAAPLPSRVGQRRRSRTAARPECLRRLSARPQGWRHGGRLAVHPVADRAAAVPGDPAGGAVPAAARP
ncbi:hypothetical protein Lal_00013808 [Lupinus albus]|nr:hypothetical protein Lal_00013808 [Lupinus albus]